MRDIVRRMHAAKFKATHGGNTPQQVAQLFEDGAGISCMSDGPCRHRVVKEALARLRKGWGRRGPAKRSGKDSGVDRSAGS